MMWMKLRSSKPHNRFQRSPFETHATAILRAMNLRNNRDYKFGEANAEHGEVLEFRDLNPFITDISPVHGIKIVKANAVPGDCHCTVQGTNFGIINLHICPAIHLSN